jgi:hypothetical protein
MELFPDLLGMGMAVAAARARNGAELVEDVQSPPPGNTCGFLVAGGVMGVSEAVEYGCLVMAVAELAGEVEGLLIADDSVLVVAQRDPLSPHESPSVTDSATRL